MVANNKYFYSSERQAAPKRGVFELEGVDTILAQNKIMHQQLQQQIELMSKRMDGLQLAAVSTTNQPPAVWRQNEENYEEQQPAQVQYMHNQGSGPNEFYGDTYNSSWRNHPNLKWGENQNSWQKNSNQSNYRNTNYQNHQTTNQNPYRKLQNNQPTSTFYPPNNPSTNHNNFHPTSTSHTQPQPPQESQRISNLEMMMEKMIKHQELANKNHEASLRNLERQIGQLSKQPTERPNNAFPSDTIPNSKKECKAIQLRSRRTLENDKVSNKKEVAAEEKDQEKSKKKEEEPQASRKGKQVMEEPPQEQRKVVKSYTHPLPYPQRLQKEIKDQQFPKFLEIFKKLEINLPLAEVLEQMSLYAKFLKELINKKRIWNKKETVILTQECSAVIQRGILPKLKDLGSFIISCTIGNMTLERAIYDLGASINLMPLSMMKELAKEEVK
nr:probable basic-leucine zipper transcription factor N [Arachis hypogaea]